MHASQFANWGNLGACNFFMPEEAYLMAFTSGDHNLTPTTNHPSTYPLALVSSRPLKRCYDRSGQTESLDFIEGPREYILVERTGTTAQL